MAQSGPPGAPGQPQPPAPPPPASWQQAPQQPAPPPARPPQSQASAWTANLTSTTPVAGPAGYFHADVPNRFITFIIDAIGIGVISWIVALIVDAILGDIVDNTLTATRGNLNMVAFLVVAVVNFGISAGYFAYLWSTSRASIGMKVLGLQIGDEKDGKTITMARAINRWLVIGIPLTLVTFWTYVSGVLGSLLSLVGLIWLIALLVSIAQSPTRQGYHDRFAHTIIVKTGRQAA